MKGWERTEGRGRKETNSFGESTACNSKNVCSRWLARGLPLACRFIILYSHAGQWPVCDEPIKPKTRLARQKLSATFERHRIVPLLVSERFTEIIAAVRARSGYLFLSTGYLLAETAIMAPKWTIPSSVMGH